MKHLHAERLMTLARFLWVLPEKKFNFRVIVSGPDKPRKELDCGSVACAIGWCPVVFPDLVGYAGSPDRRFSYVVVPLDKHGHREYMETRHMARVGEHLFGLDGQQVAALFDWGVCAPGIERSERDASAKDIAKKIADFVHYSLPDFDTALA